MKKDFEFSHFSRVLKYTWQTQPMLPYVFLVAAIPLLIAGLLRLASMDYVSSFNNGPYLGFCLYFIGSTWLYAGLMFREFGTFNTSCRFLLLPGSVLEKWLAKALLVFVVFPAIAWLSYQVAFQILGVLSARLFAFRFQAIDWGAIEMKAFLFIFYLSLPAAFASGLIWKRFGLLKGIVFVSVWLVLLYFFIDANTQSYNYNEPSVMLMFELKLPFDELKCQGNRCLMIQLFWIFGAYLPSMLLLASTYFFTLKKEV